MIYMNNAATSYPKPDCVAEAVTDVLNREPGDSYRGGHGQDTFAMLRGELADLLGVSQPEQIALGPNASWGLNTGIFGLPLKSGDCVVATKAEHNSVLRPLYRLRQRGVRVILLDTDETGRVKPELWAEAMRKYRPALAVFTHASNVTGAVNDAEAFCRAAKDAGARVLVDASQTLGFIPVKAENWNADMVAFTGHKYLLGPQGTGGLWVSPEVKLEPLLTGGTGIHSDMDTMPEEMPLHLEAGTGNEPSCAGLLAAIRWQKDNPLKRSEILSRADRLSGALERLGAKVILPQGERTPVISFLLPGITPEETGYILRESCDIVCRTGLHCAPKIFPCLGVPQTVRLSLSRFNTDDEVNEVIEAVEAIIP